MSASPYGNGRSVQVLCCFSIVVGAVHGVYFLSLVIQRALLHKKKLMFSVKPVEFIEHFDITPCSSIRELTETCAGVGPGGSIAATAQLFSVLVQRQLMARVHRITERFGLEGTLQTISFHPPALGRAPFHQSRVLQAPSNLALNPARDGAATAPLGSLGQDLTTFQST